MALAIDVTPRTTENAARAVFATTASAARAVFATTESAARAVLAWLVAVAAWATIIWNRAQHRRAEETARLSSTAEPLGSYILDEKIGEGGMGIVYKAHQAGLERLTAIKVLPIDRAEARSVERFEREFRMTSRLSHPNTVAVHDFGRTPEGSLFYAMEYLEGQDLQQLVERSGAQPPARVAHLLAQVCGALIEAHDRRWIHRDIKPANVFLCDRGEMRDTVKVLDFGLVKEFGSQASDAREAEIDVIVGTPTYLSPEAMTAPETMDGRSDLYAVGALGYFLLTGAPPFVGKTVLEVCAQHLHCEPVPPSARTPRIVPAKLEHLILSCLAKSPEARPRDAATLRAALLPFAAEWTSGWTRDREAGSHGNVAISDDTIGRAMREAA